MGGMFNLGGMARCLESPWRIDVGVEGGWWFLRFWFSQSSRINEVNTRKLRTRCTGQSTT